VCKLWIPAGESQTISIKHMPLWAVTNILNERFSTAILKRQEHLKELAIHHILAELGQWFDGHEVVGAYGIIKEEQKHGLYPNGLIFSTSSETDIRQHLGISTAIEYLKVPTVDNGINLDQFVLDAYKVCLVAEFTPVVKRPNRERHLLFYMTIVQ